MSLKYKKRYCVIIGEETHIQLQDVSVARTDSRFFELVRNHSWHFINRKGSGRSERVSARVFGVNTPLHHLILGKPPPGLMVDHIDGDVRNNLMTNLRFVTNSQNQHNQHRFKNKFKGVHWYTRDQEWAAHIWVNKKSINLGHFETAEEAARAYDKKAIELWGEFACTNQKLGLL